jgi:3'-5' exoribonuclease
MIIELEMLHDKLAHLLGFPPELKILIEHMIISHHGHYEFGSPKLPMFPEALMLHYLDDLDSKMESMRAQFEREADFDSPWTSYNPSLARPLLNTKKFLEKGLAASREVESRKPAAAASNGNVGEPAAVPDVDIQAESAAPSQTAEKEPELSPLEALERKFASHKVTPVAGAGKSS